MRTITSPVPSTAATDAPFPERLEAAYREGFARLVSAAAAITGDPESGREAVQEAFARMLASSGPRKPEALEAWMWAAVVNSARQERRSAWRRTRRISWDSAERAAPERPDRDAAVSAAIAALPERQRTVLFLRYYADLDYRTIATALGVRTGTVSAALHAAHAAVRRTMEESS